MLSPQSWWSELSTVGKILTGLAAAIGGIRAIWTPLSNAASWVIERYDKPVYAVLEGRKRIEWVTANPAPIVMTPVSVTFVSTVVKRNPKSVLKTLARLEKKEKVHQGPYGWSWGPRIIHRGSVIDPSAEMGC